LLCDGADGPIIELKFYSTDLKTGEYFLRKMGPLSFLQKTRLFEFINGTNWTKTLEIDYDMWDVARFSRNEDEVSSLEVLLLRNPRLILIIPALFILVVFCVFLFGVGAAAENGQANANNNARANGPNGIGPAERRHPAAARAERARGRFQGSFTWTLFAAVIWGYYILSEVVCALLHPPPMSCLVLFVCFFFFNNAYITSSNYSKYTHDDTKNKYYYKRNQQVK
jgi:hypothetical protein